MSKYASKVVGQAKAWLGYNEADGSHKKIIDVYNTQKPLPRSYPVKYTDQWCATFVSSVAVQLGYTDIMPTECSCYYMIEKYKKLGCWIEDDSRVPNPGDIIFYDWDDNGVGDTRGDSEHVGIVEKVVGNTITVIEGNYKKAVTRREIAVNGRYIRGYGVPKYDVEVVQKKTITEVAKEVMDGKYGNGSVRVNKLKAEGYDPDAVQAEVNRLCKGNTKSITEVAQDVLNGKYGNGNARKKKLIAEGYDPDVVQDEVNRLCAEKNPAPKPATVKVDGAKSFNASKAGTYKVRSAIGLKLRAGASTSKSILETMANGSNVTCYGYYTGSWLYVVSASGKTGFCHSAYLKKV